MTVDRDRLTVLASEFSDLRLSVDPRTGGPVELWRESDPERSVGLRAAVHVISGGTEHRSPTGGLEYHDTVDVTADGTVDVTGDGTADGTREVTGDIPGGPDAAAEVATSIALESRTYRISAHTTAPADWQLTWRYEFRASHPLLAVSVEVAALNEHCVARNVHIELAATLEDPDQWRIHAPGNALRADLPLKSLTQPTGVSPAGGLRGSTGMIVAEQVTTETSLVLWPLSKTEIGEITLSPTPSGILVTWQSDVAGQPGTAAPLLASAIYLDLQPTPYASLLSEIPVWLDTLGMSTPDSAPAWVRQASIFEVQIGFSVFNGDWRYSPYPEAKDLLADLGRIQDLGYNTLQIMPRQPYPSYNVHDYADITTSYGNEADLGQIVATAHARGMHVILDILLHGVIDKESMRQAVQSVRTGPFADRLGEATPDSFSVDLSAGDSYLISWSRHIIDFEQYWIGGSPEHHPLIDTHPEWFCRDSAGNITGVYTKSFDVAHPGWQRYFIDACLHLVRVLDVDGFRFDAPTYNYFHNWSPRTRTNAGVSLLGCLPLFRQLRKELKALKPESLMYTEPSGVLLRESMDLNYNYDEQWLITSVMEPGGPDRQGVRTAAEVGRWLAERDAALPAGALTAHHIDSHDTFWWPLPGSKWRRDVYGAPAAAAWMTLFALSGGPYMTFVGGEQDIEKQVLAVNTLRARRPEFSDGVSDHAAVSVDDVNVYAVVRRGSAGSAVVLVNLGGEATTIDCRLDLPDPTHNGVVAADGLGGETVHFESRAGRSAAKIVLPAFGTKALLLPAF